MILITGEVNMNENPYRMGAECSVLIHIKGKHTNVFFSLFYWKNGYLYDIITVYIIL